MTEPQAEVIRALARRFSYIFTRRYLTDWEPLTDDEVWNDPWL